MKKLLVLGIGNILLGDEGVGVHAVEELKKEEWPEYVHLVDGGTFTHDIFHILEGYDGLLVLDIVHGGKDGGTVYYLEEKDIIGPSSEVKGLYWTPKVWQILKHFAGSFRQAQQTSYLWKSRTTLNISFSEN